MIKNYLVLPLKIDDSEGWADLQFSVVETLENKDGTLIKAISLYEGHELGLEVFIPNATTDDKGFGEGIILKSIGVKSDRLLKLLSQLYAQNIENTLKFRDSLRVPYVDLNKFAESVTGAAPQDISSTMKYKLFFEGEKEEEYAEIYLNYIITEQRLELKEKDEDYRPLVIKFLSK